MLAGRVARGVVQPGPRSPATGRQDTKGAAAAAYGRRTCSPSAVIWGALTSGACTGGMAGWQVTLIAVGAALAAAATAVLLDRRLASHRRAATTA